MSEDAGNCGTTWHFDVSIHFVQISCPATLKPVYLSQPPFPQPKGLPYLQHHSSQKKRVVDQGRLESWEPKSTGL